MNKKNLLLAGSSDTNYKQALLSRLSAMHADQSLARGGELELLGQGQSVVCDLILDGDWRGSLNSRHFAPAPVQPE